MKYQKVLAIGVFDLFHVGHLRYLKHARLLGAELLVGVTPDDITLAVKGKRPVIPEAQRLEMVQGLGWVDYVKLIPTTLNDTDAAAVWIKEWGADHVVVGGNWENSSRWNRLTPRLEEQTISVSFFPETQEQSSTQIKALIHRMSTNSESDFGDIRSA
jgi:cytidyltransferase-like protein